jgi:YVTN family beta-propeller protein
MVGARRILAIGVALVSLAGLPGQEKQQHSGRTDQGFLLPNGWTVAPAGEQVPLTDMPLNIVALSDNRHALVASSGYNEHKIVLVDLHPLQRERVQSSQATPSSWFGLALSPKQDKVWWSGGGSGLLHTYDLKEHQLVRTSAAEPPIGPLSKASKNSMDRSFRSGLAFDAARDRLYSLDINRGLIIAQDLKTGTLSRPARCGDRPYDVVLAPNGTQLYVSDWAQRTVLVIDPSDFRVVGKIAVGEHPNQLALHPRDGRLFVACASSNCVSVVDTARGTVTETIMTGLFPRAPEGSTPDAVAVAPDGKSLFVANADNNCVAVIDINVPNKSQVKGFIPTGWYPTAVAVTPDSKTLLVGVGKGNQTQANPLFPANSGKSDPRKRGLKWPYIGSTMTGALSIVPVPDEKHLAAYSDTVYRNCPYSDKLLEKATSPGNTVIPEKVGARCPIQHVIYIIKENRTYDQVFGAMKEGNGDPALVMFGEDVTPNHHQIAREFVLFDNLYCNGQVSQDGHPWSTMAYNTDYVGRDWHLTYSGRKGVDDDDEDNLSKAPSGYLWDACARHGLTYRSYGEYGHRVSQGTKFKMEGRVPGLVGHMSPEYGIVTKTPGERVRDTDRVDVFLKEFRQYEKDGTLPRFIVMSLGEDHTQGTTPGAYTPQASVASNDLALGQLVDAVTRSKYWHETAIFVIEDDAQNGPDHVDAHRTVGLVISPYAKRHFVDHTQYSTVSMLRTMELILGLPPLSQYDAAARPMFAAFTDKANPAPYKSELARIDLNLRNPSTAYGAARSAQMDFSEYDRVNDFELNEILWRAIKGKDAPLPPAVRRAIAMRTYAEPK